MPTSDKLQTNIIFVWSKFYSFDNLCGLMKIRSPVQIRQKAKNYGGAWACSLVGRASHLHCEGREFESLQVHTSASSVQAEIDECERRDEKRPSEEVVLSEIEGNLFRSTLLLLGTSILERGCFYEAISLLISTRPLAREGEYKLIS